MPETAPPAGSLAEALATIPDPRRAHLRVHDLVPLLQFAVAALLCGCRSLYAMAQWGQERREDDPELLVALGLRPGRSPSVATLHRVFKRLDVMAFEQALGEWLAHSGIAPHEPLAVDGKTLRGVHGEGIPGAHLVSVYALRAGAVLAQIRAAAKGGELAATKAALAQVDLQGRVVKRATGSPVWAGGRRGRAACSGSTGSTGGSRTGCIGCGTSPSRRIAAKCAAARRPRCVRGCAAWGSRSCAGWGPPTSPPR